MKKLFLIILNILFVFSIFAEGSKLPRLAVVEFSINDSKNQKLVNDAIAVRNLVQSNIVKTGCYDVIARAEIDKLLENQEISISSISSNENLNKLKLLNIHYLITGSVDAMDSYYQVSISVLDVSNGRFPHSDEEFMENSAPEVNKGVKSLVTRFINGINTNGTEIVSLAVNKNLGDSDDFALVEGCEGGDLLVCKHEVTQEEFELIMKNNPSDNSEGRKGHYPVECVNWYDAIEYCNRRSISEGMKPCYSLYEKTDCSLWGEKDEAWEKVKCDFNTDGYRLPTMEEWWYFARGGNKSKGYKYPGSDDINVVSWNYYNSNYSTHAVMQKIPNELGIYDLHGNVSEWCWEEEWGLGPEHVVIGGSFGSWGYSETSKDFKDFLNDIGYDEAMAGMPSSSRCYWCGFRVVRSYTK